VQAVRCCEFRLSAFRGIGKRWRQENGNGVIQSSGSDGLRGAGLPHLYAAGSGESDGLAKRFVIIALGGMFRLMPLGGIGLWNHLA